MPLKCCIHRHWSSWKQDVRLWPLWHHLLWRVLVWSPKKLLTSSRIVSKTDARPNSALWTFLTSWRHLFDRFDIDHSGTISLSEFSAALTAFGYRLSQAYVGELFEAYDVRGRNVLSFDMFVQACISLKRMVSLCLLLDIRVDARPNLERCDEWAIASTKNDWPRGQQEQAANTHPLL